MPTPTATMTVEWPREKKNPVASGRWPSDMSLRVTLSMADRWSASKACRRPRVHAVIATPRPTPSLAYWKWCGITARTKIAQPLAFSRKITAAMTASRTRSAGWRRGTGAGGLSTAILHEMPEDRGPTDRPSSEDRNRAQQQATGLIPEGASPLRDSARFSLDFAAVAPPRREAATWQP